MSKASETAVVPPSLVADYMSTTIRSIDIDATLKEAGGLLEASRVGSLLVRHRD
jgi:CBS domain-containing protein